MLRFIPKCKDARTLEIGCGTGAFSRLLVGCSEKWGIEPSEAGDIAVNHLTTVLKGTFDEVKSKLPKSYFDIVICNDVIEHMPDHQQFFGEISQFMRPDGVIVGSIPNVRFYDNMFKMLFEKDWLYKEDGILDKTHLAFFTERSLRRTIERSGFELLDLRGLNLDVQIDYSRKSRLYFFLARVLSRATMGYFYDIRYLQFGFQARPKGKSCVQS